MAKLYLICGKICSGKSRYARELKEKQGGVIFSCDELILSLFMEDLKEKHDAISAAAREYLLKKAMETVAAGCNVILDWGFWWADNRRIVTEKLREADCPLEWHYIDVTDAGWDKNIRHRNERVLRGETQDYYVDDGLRQKCLSLFDVPEKEEMDQWIMNG